MGSPLVESARPAFTRQFRIHALLLVALVAGASVSVDTSAASGRQSDQVEASALISLKEPTEPTPIPTVHHHVFPTGSVTGGLDGKPVEGAVVRVTVKYHSISATTDSRGHYLAKRSFTNGEFHPSQQADYEIAAAGYATARRTVHVDPSTRFLSECFHLVGLVYLPLLRAR